MNCSFNDEFTVYIEGLPFSASENDVIKFFEPAGIVQSVRLPKWHDSGKLRGYGHVKFCAPEMATKALEQDGEFYKDNPTIYNVFTFLCYSGMYMQNRFIKVDRPMVPRVLQKKEITQIVRPPGCHTVFVKNIPYDCTQDDVKESFMVCGKINNVRLAVWGHTNQLKGFGYVEFKSEESAEIAVKKSGAILVKGRPVICDFETNQPKRSFKSLSEIQKANARKTDEATSRNIPNMLS